MADAGTYLKPASNLARHEAAPSPDVGVLEQCYPAPCKDVYSSPVSDFTARLRCRAHNGCKRVETSTQEKQGRIGDNWMRSRIARMTGIRRAVLGAVALTLMLASVAAAGTGKGAIFNLGVVNSVSGYLTTLTGSMAGRMLQVTNTSTATTAGAIGATNKSTTASTIRAQNTGNGPALEAVVPSGKSPMRVSGGAAKVANLDADKLDGLDQAALQRRVGSACAVGSSIRAISATGAVTCESKSANAGHADTATNATNATNAANANSAGNSDTLDGQDSTAFAPAAHAHDSEYVNEEQAGSVSSSMLADGAALGEIADDDGAGSGLDADTLDGLNPSSFLASTAGAVQTSNLANGSVTNGKLGSDSVYSDKIINGGVFASDLADGAARSEILDDDGSGSSLDADALDGIDSKGFIQGGGEVKRGARAFAAGYPGWGAFLTTPNITGTPNIGGLTIGYLCPSDLTQNGVIVIRNDSGEAVNVFLDNGGVNPLYQQLAANGGRWDNYAAATGEHYTIQVQGTHVTTIEAFTVHRTADCHTQGMATVSR